MKISYPLACLLASLAETEATRLGVSMAIALVDPEGGLLSFGRMEGTLPVSTELSVSKAFTAAVLRMTTHELGALAQPGGALYGIQQTHQGRIVLFGGGFPLRLQGKVAGGIGISGGSVEQDIRVGLHAVEALEEMGRWAERLGHGPGIPRRAALGSPTQLADKLKDELEKIHCTLPDREMTILTGAVLVAGCSGP